MSFNIKKISSYAFIALLWSNNCYATLVGHYDLNGNALDNISSNVAPSTDISGAPDRFGSPNSAVSLNGSSSIIQPLDVGINDASQDFSLSIWFKPNTSGFLGGLISNNTPAGPLNGWSTVSRIGSDNRMLFLTGAAQNSSAENTTTSVNTATVGQWNHAAFIYDKDGPTSNLSIYLNSAFESSASKNFSTVGTMREDWLLGAQYGTGLIPQFYLDGFLDDFRIYDTALTSAQVSALASQVPEPAAVWLFGTGLAGLAAWRYRRSVKA